jgi:hypothetical protein
MGTRPADPTTFWVLMSAEAFVPGKMNSSPAGMLSQAERGRSKFFERISFYLLLGGRSWGNRGTHWIVCKDFGGEEGIVF